MLEFHDLLRPQSYGFGNHDCILGIHDGKTKINWGPSLKIVFCATFPKGTISPVDSYLSAYLSAKFI